MYHARAPSCRTHRISHWCSVPVCQAIDVASWFGGSDASWAPKRDTYSLIKNMVAYRTGSPTYSKLSDGRVAPLSQEDVTPETVIEYEDIYADASEEPYNDDY